MKVKHDDLGYYGAAIYDWDIDSYLLLVKLGNGDIEWEYHNKKGKHLIFKDQELNKHEIRDGILKIEDYTKTNLINLILIPYKYSVHEPTIVGAAVALKKESACSDIQTPDTVNFDHEFYSHILNLDFKTAEKLHLILTVMDA